MKIKLDFNIVLVVAFIASAFFGQIIFGFLFYAVLCYAFLRKESSLAILFLSGLVKISPTVSALPIDLTFLSLFIYLMFRIRDILSKRAINMAMLQINFVLLLAGLVIVASFLYTDATWRYLSQSGVYIIALYVPLSLLILNDLRIGTLAQNRLSFFVRPIVFIAALWTGLGFHNDLYNIPLNQAENPQAFVAHLSAFGENYMYFSSFVCFIIIYFYVQIFHLKKSFIIGVLFIITHCYLLVNSPARGLTVGLITSLFLLSLPLLRKIRANYLITLFVITGFVIVGGIYYLNNELSKEQLESLARLTDFSTQGKSVSDRIISVKNGFAEWNDTLFNILFGLGVDSVAFINDDPGLYAHNIILEAILEYGLLGSVPILLFFFFAFYTSQRLLMFGINTKDTTILWVLGVYYMIFIFSLFSGTLGNSRLLWILTSIIYLLSASVSRFKEELNNNELKSEKNTTPF